MSIDHLLVERPDRIAFTHFADLLSRAPSPWQIRGIFRENSVNLLYGQRGSFKSFVALDMAASIASGTPWQGHEVVNPGLVIYVAGEGGGGMVQRARAWSESHQISPRRVNVQFVTEPVTMTTEHDDVEILIHRIKDLIGWRGDGEVDVETGYLFDHPHAREWPVLIVVDTVARCFFGDENAPEDMGMFVQTVDRLKIEFNCSILLVHHTGRDPSHERGHTSLAGACETIYQLDCDHDAYPKALVLDCKKMKDSREAEALELLVNEVQVQRYPHDDPDEDLSSVVLVRADLEMQDRQDKLFTILDTHGPLSWSDWQSSSNMAKTSFQRQVVELKQNGKIIKENGLWRVI